jgi:16S rRNA (cytosine1402-N4)-methyltransferase
MSHRPVLLHEAIQYLALQPNDIVVDATLGAAGHASEIANALSKKGTLIGFDLDADAVARAQDALAAVKPVVHLIEADFRELRRQLEQRGIKKITKALFDLGWSSNQLDSGRGFSFMRDEPLIMTYRMQAGIVTAATIVNEWQEQTIADILFGFGEERYSRKIAKAIVERRLKKPFTTSSELAEFVKSAVPLRYRHGRIHPATRTFQALRMAVNDELGALEEGLRAAFELLEVGGRIGVITFHSVEDRAVKQLFASFEKAGHAKRISKKPIVPTDAEIAENHRSRSAKLRVIEKTS